MGLEELRDAIESLESTAADVRLGASLGHGVAAVVSKGKLSGVHEKKEGAEADPEDFSVAVATARKEFCISGGSGKAFDKFANIVSPWLAKLVAYGESVRFSPEEMGNLFELLKSLNPQEIREHVRSLVAMAAQGLSALHSEDIVHRDIKPGNMLFTKSKIAGKDHYHLVISDLDGLALVDPRGHLDGHHSYTVFTPYYTPLNYEQEDRKAVDCYALGKTVQVILAYGYYDNNIEHPDFLLNPAEIKCPAGMTAADFTVFRQLHELRHGLTLPDDSTRMTIDAVKKSELFGENPDRRGDFFKDLDREGKTHTDVWLGEYYAGRSALPDDYFLLIPDVIKPVAREAEHLAVKLNLMLDLQGNLIENFPEDMPALELSAIHDNAEAVLAEVRRCGNTVPDEYLAILATLSTEAEAYLYADGERLLGDIDKLRLLAEPRAEPRAEQGATQGRDLTTVSAQVAQLRERIRDMSPAGPYQENWVSALEKEIDSIDLIVYRGTKMPARLRGNKNKSLVEYSFGLMRENERLGRDIEASPVSGNLESIALRYVALHKKSVLLTKAVMEIKSLRGSSELKLYLPTIKADTSATGVELFEEYFQLAKEYDQLWQRWSDELPNKLNRPEELLKKEAKLQKKIKARSGKKGVGVLEVKILEEMLKQRRVQPIATVPMRCLKETIALLAAQPGIRHRGSAFFARSAPEETEELEFFTGLRENFDHLA